MFSTPQKQPAATTSEATSDDRPEESTATVVLRSASRCRSPGCLPPYAVAESGSSRSKRQTIVSSFALALLDGAPTLGGWVAAQRKRILRALSTRQAHPSLVVCFLSFFRQARHRKRKPEQKAGFLAGREGLL